MSNTRFPYGYAYVCAPPRAGTPVDLYYCLWREVGVGAGVALGGGVGRQPAA